MNRLITVREVEAIISSAALTLGTEMVSLADVAGRVLAEDIRADRALPPYRRAMMDGVALRCGETPLGGILCLAGLLAAGDPPPRPLGPGEAWEIMTGAAVPPDCDAVVPYEDWGNGFQVVMEPRPGQYIHETGIDAAQGEVLLRAGRRIGPVDVAIAASVGHETLRVKCRPRLALLTTGDEAVSAPETPEPWQIRRSNGVMIEAALRASGFSVPFHEHVADELEATRLAIRRAMDSCDVLLVCGGISKGRRDHVRDALGGFLGDPAFNGVKQRPGKPLAFWHGPPPVFALPGNPVSVLACFARYVLPALQDLEGCRSEPRRLHGSSLRPLPEFTWLATFDGTVPHLPKNSGDFISVAGSTGVVEIPPEAAFTPGEPLAFYPFTL